MAEKATTAVLGLVLPSYVDKADVADINANSQEIEKIFAGDSTSSDANRKKGVYKRISDLEDKLGDSGDIATKEYVDQLLGEIAETAY